MMNPLLKASLAATMIASAGSAWTAAITVLPSQVANSSTLGQWSRVNGAANGAASVSATYTPSGESGSLELNGPNVAGASKIDVQMQWSFASATANGYTLGNLTALGYDWMRAGGTSTAHFAPVLRLLYDVDGNSATMTDRGMLIWEQIYNGAGVVNGAWTSSDILDGYFWQRVASPSGTVEIYNYDLDDWMNPALTKTSGNVQGDTLNANSLIYGINVGIGSGWSGTFLGAVDHITLGFSGNSTTWNFETQLGTVPEPGSLALAGLALAGLAVCGRRTRRKG